MGVVEEIRSDGAPEAIGPYSQAVRSGNILYCSGQIPLDPESGALVAGDVAAQTRRVLENLRAVLREGGSSFARVVKTTVYLADMGDFGSMNEVYAEYFRDHRPARATVEVSALPRGVAVEIDAIAVVDPTPRPSEDSDPVNWRDEA